MRPTQPTPCHNNDESDYAETYCECLQVKMLYSIFHTIFLIIFNMLIPHNKTGIFMPKK